MKTLSIHLAQRLAIVSVRDFARFSRSVEAQVLLVAAAAAFCVSFGTFNLGRTSSFDDRTLLLAMLAAGGMPSAYSPPALCSVSTASANLNHFALETLAKE